MDCRETLLLALGLLGGVLGCQSQGTAPAASSVPVTMIPEGAAIEKEADLPPKMPKAATCAAFGDFRAREAESPELTPLQQQQHREVARKAYQQALAIDPNYLPAQRGLARLYAAMGDHAHAVATYEKALKLHPQDGGLWHELGMAHARKKDWGPGLECLAKAVEREPENRQYVNALGFALARVGRHQESLECFARVHGEARAHYNLARMLRHLNQPEQAREHLRRALQQDPRLDHAQALLTEMDGGAPQAVRPVAYTEGAPDAPAEKTATVPLPPFNPPGGTSPGAEAPAPR